MLTLALVGPLSAVADVPVASVVNDPPWPYTRVAVKPGTPPEAAKYSTRLLL